MYYLFNIPFLYFSETECFKNVLLAICAKNKKHLIKIFLSNTKLLTAVNISAFHFLKNGGVPPGRGTNCLTMGKYYFHTYYIRLGDNLENILNIKYEARNEEKLLEVLDIFNSLSENKYILKIIKCPFPLFLQHSNQKEISPIIYDFVNHPLFDRNVLRLINDY
jgi:hypothetical protein